MPSPPINPIIQSPPVPLDSSDRSIPSIQPIPSLSLQHIARVGVGLNASSGFLSFRIPRIKRRAWRREGDQTPNGEVPGITKTLFFPFFSLSFPFSHAELCDRLHGLFIQIPCPLIGSNPFSLGPVRRAVWIAVVCDRLQGE
jgi:hypothetical protein